MQRTTPPPTPPTGPTSPAAATHPSSTAPAASPPRWTGHAAAPRESWPDEDPVLATVGPGTIDPARWDEDLSADADALAELFLGEAAFAPPIPPNSSDDEPGDFGGDDEGDDEDPHGPGVHLEALILGHLPVLGAAWVNGYAGILSSRVQAPVGVARLRGGFLTIDAVGLGTSGLEATGSVDDAIAAINARSGRWLLSTDPTDEPQLVRTANPSGVTLLTSAEDAAIVGSYQAIKGLLESHPGESSWPEDADLTIALAGSPPDRSQLAGDKIRSAVRTFLGRRVHLDICPQRINSSASRSLYAGPWSGDITHLADRLAAPIPSTSIPRAPHIPPPPQATAAQAHASPAATPPAPDTAPAAVETKPPHAHASAHPTSAMCTSPAPLASLIPGLDPIKLVCPYAPAIQLALDPAGALHLISCADTFTTLHRAAAWARAHEPLLQAALPHFRSSSTPPTCHVLSEDPAALRPLIESDVRVHLLIKISVGTQEIALAKRLN